jgi:hypothetical protein
MQRQLKLSLLPIAAAVFRKVVVGEATTRKKEKKE